MRRILLAALLTAGIGVAALPAVAQNATPAAKPLPVYKPKPKPGTRENTEAAYAAYKKTIDDYQAACAKKGQNLATLENAYRAINFTDAYNAAADEVSRQPQVFTVKDEVLHAQTKYLGLLSKKNEVDTSAEISAKKKYDSAVKKHHDLFLQVLEDTDRAVSKKVFGQDTHPAQIQWCPQHVALYEASQKAVQPPAPAAKTATGVGASANCAPQTGITGALENEACQEKHSGAK